MIFSAGRPARQAKGGNQNFTMKDMKDMKGGGGNYKVCGGGGVGGIRVTRVGWRSRSYAHILTHSHTLTLTYPHTSSSRRVTPLPREECVRFLVGEPGVRLPALAVPKPDFVPMCL